MARLTLFDNIVAAQRVCVNVSVDKKQITSFACNLWHFIMFGRLALDSFVVYKMCGTEIGFCACILWILLVFIGFDTNIISYLVAMQLHVSVITKKI